MILKNINGEANNKVLYLSLLYDVGPIGNSA